VDHELKNYYEVLEIPISSTQEEIYDGYNRAKNAYSGDRLALYSLMTEDECREMVNLIDEAFSILSDPIKRRKYDKARGFNQGNDAAVSDYVSPYSPRATNVYQNENTANADVSIFSDNAGPSATILPTRDHHGFREEDRTFPSPRASRIDHDLRDLFDSPGKTSGNPFDQDDFTINKNEHEISRITAQKKFGLEFKKDHQMEQEIENAQVYTGDFLKKIREYKNVTIERMSEMTKISKTYIRYIEGDEFEKLPALAYVRGFVFQYAKCLKLAPELIATSYLHHLKNLKSVKTA